MIGHRRIPSAQQSQYLSSAPAPVAQTPTQTTAAASIPVVQTAPPPLVAAVPTQPAAIAQVPVAAVA